MCLTAPEWFAPSRGRHGGGNRKLADHTVPTFRKQSVNRRWGLASEASGPSPRNSLPPTWRWGPLKVPQPSQTVPTGDKVSNMEAYRV